MNLERLHRLKRGAWLALSMIANSSVSAPSYGAAMSESQVSAEYARIKTAVAQRYKELLREEAARGHPQDDYLADSLPPALVDANLVAVFDCGFTPGLDFDVGSLDGWPDGVHAGTPRWVATLFFVAKAVTVVNVTADIYGYPREVWLSSLTSYEKRGIAAAQALAQREASNLDATTTSLPDYPVDVISSMEAYRARTRMTTPQLVPQAECGAGESAVNIEAEPVARRIRLIPEFFARLCEQTSRPLHSDACPYWREAPQGSLFSVSGLYRFQVEWPDGAKRAGMVDFDKLSYEKDAPTFRIKR